MSDTHANQWIPVSERLPGDAQTKLLRLSSNTTRTGYAHMGVWYLHGLHEPTEPVPDVTHWMDLPEPPEPPKLADTFEAWWAQCRDIGGKFDDYGICCQDAQFIWNAAKEHYAKQRDYHRGFEDAAIAFESMVNRILEGKDDGMGTLEIPQLEKLRRVLLERLKPLPDFETWWKKQEMASTDGSLCELDCFIVAKCAARAIWNAAQGKPEA